MTSANAAVRRSRIGRRASTLPRCCSLAQDASVLPQPVAGAADGLDRVNPERPVDLLAQVADVDIDDVRPVLVGVVPGVLEPLVAGDDVAGAARQRLEECELLG